VRHALLLAGAVLPVRALAQSVETGKQTPVVTVSGAFFALSVADLEASTKWYAEKLGLELTTHVPGRVAVLKGGGLSVELIHEAAARPLRSLLPAAREVTGVHGIVKVGFLVTDFDRTLDALKARGVEVAYGPWPKRPDQAANVILRDNGGNLIQLFGP